MKTPKRKELTADEMAFVEASVAVSDGYGLRAWKERGRIHVEAVAPAPGQVRLVKAKGRREK